MDLTQLANLGEFIGGVAVLMTLIYLAVQVRQGASAQKTAADVALGDALRGNVIAFSTFRQMLIHEAVGAAWAKADRDEELSSNEELQLQVVVNELAWTAASAVQTFQATGGEEYAQLVPEVLVDEVRMLGGANRPVCDAWDRVAVSLRKGGVDDLADRVAAGLAREASAR